MAEIHERLQKLRAPFWFEKWGVPYSLLAPTVFLAVKNLRVRGFTNRLRQLVKRKRREQIVMIDAGYEIAGRELECAICIFCDASILRQIADVKPRLLRFPAFQYIQCLRIIGPTIDQANFPVVVGLPKDRGEHLVEKLRRRIVNRQEQADFRTPRPAPRYLALLIEPICIQLVLANPCRVALHRIENWRRHTLCRWRGFRFRQKYPP